MSLLNDPNLVRDAFWTSALNKMFATTNEETDPIEFAGTQFMLGRMSPNLMMVVKLPENAADMTEEEVEEFVTGVFDTLEDGPIPNLPG